MTYFCATILIAFILFVTYRLGWMNGAMYIHKKNKEGK